MEIVIFCHSPLFSKKKCLGIRFPGANFSWGLSTVSKYLNNLCQWNELSSILYDFVLAQQFQGTSTISVNRRKVITWSRHYWLQVESWSGKERPVICFFKRTRTNPPHYYIYVIQSRPFITMSRPLPPPELDSVQQQQECPLLALESSWSAWLFDNDWIVSMSYWKRAK